MLISMHIIADHLQQYDPQCHLTTFDLNIISCRLYHPQDALRSNTVYLGSSRDIFLDDIDTLVLIHENEWIRLNTTNKSEVMNQVLNLIEEYALWHQEMLELVASSAMIQDLVDVSAEYLKKPFILVDAGQRLLAISPGFPKGSIDHIFDEMLENGYANMNFLAAVHERITTVDSDDELHYYEDPCLPHPIYQQPFHIQHQLVGEACLIDMNGEISKGELLTFQFMCQHVKRWFDSNIQVHEQLQMQLQLQQAVSDEDFDQSELTWHLQLQGWRESDQIILLKLDAPYHPYNINEHLSRSINSLFHIYATTVEYSICCLCNLTTTPWTTLTEHLQPILHSGKYYGVYSDSFTLKDSFYENYRMISAASTHCEKQVGTLYEAKKHIHYYIFEEIARHLTTEQVHPALKQLQDYDANHHSDLYQTLQVYLEQERSPVATAKLLQLHRNSLAYRLDKINEIIQTDLDDPDIRLFLRLSFVRDQHQATNVHE